MYMQSSKHLFDQCRGPPMHCAFSRHAGRLLRHNSVQAALADPAMSGHWPKVGVIDIVAEITLLHADRTFSRCIWGNFGI